MVENDGVCFWCDIVLENRHVSKKCQSDNSRTVDHFIPKSRGGANTRNNYLASCYRCNQLRGDISPAIFCDVLDRCNPHMVSKKYVDETAKRLVENKSKGISKFKGLPLPFYNHLIPSENLMKNFRNGEVNKKCTICQCGLSHENNLHNSARVYKIQKEYTLSEFLICKECRDLINYTSSAAALRLAAEETGFDKFKMLKIEERKKLANRCLVFLKTMLRANEYKGLPV